MPAYMAAHHECTWCGMMNLPELGLQMVMRHCHMGAGKSSQCSQQRSYLSFPPFLSFLLKQQKTRLVARGTIYKILLLYF